jgi:hypothetical protein
MSAYDETSTARPADSVAGFLAALAIFVGLIGVAWHPLRLIVPAMLISLIAAGMGGRHKRLAFAGVMIVAACFFFGMMVAVATSHPLW